MEPKILAIGGVPGAGKSTLVKQFISRFSDWRELKPAPLLNALYSPSLDLYVLGRYPENEVFGGTDKLSMAVQPRAKEWVTTTRSNVMFEGDRLFNVSFLSFLHEEAPHTLSILLLEAEAETLTLRYEERGSNQSEKFIKGRRTKVEGVSAAFPDLLRRVSNQTAEDLEDNTAHIISYFAK